MRLTVVLVAAAVVGSAAATHGDLSPADVLSLHRRIKAIRRHARRAQASPTAATGVPLVVSQQVVCPTIAAGGSLNYCACRALALAPSDMRADQINDIVDTQSQFGCMCAEFLRS